VGSVLGGLLGKGAGSTGSTGTGGLAGDLKKSPINSIIVRGNAGSGKVELQQALIQSPAFQATATGNIALADVLTNSTVQIPVSIWLERSIAQRINLAGTAGPNDVYAKLPDFLTITGTLGDNKPKINYAALGGAILQGTGGKTGQAGNVLQGLGGLLGGKTSTNAPATNQSPVNNLFKGLFK
jgi:hypothetical protein